MLSVSKWLIIFCDSFDFFSSLFDSISFRHLLKWCVLPSSSIQFFFFSIIILSLSLCLLLMLLVCSLFKFTANRILLKFMYKNVTELNHNENNNSKLSRESHDRRLADDCDDCNRRPLMVSYLDRQWTLFLSPINLEWRLSVMDLSFPI